MTGFCSSRWRPTTILDYSFVNNFVKSHHKKLEFCGFDSCKVIRVGLYFSINVAFEINRNIQDSVRTTILEYCFIKRFVNTAHSMIELCASVLSKIVD